jgi:hypothetical protein
MASNIQELLHLFARNLFYKLLSTFSLRGHKSLPGSFLNHPLLVDIPLTATWHLCVMTTASLKAYVTARLKHVLQRTMIRLIALLSSCSGPDLEIFGYHKPSVVSSPVLAWYVQLKVKISDYLGNQLRHLQKRNVPSLTSPGSQTKLQLVRAEPRDCEKAYR